MKGPEQLRRILSPQSFCPAPPPVISHLQGYASLVPLVPSNSSLCEKEGDTVEGEQQGSRCNTPRGSGNLGGHPGVRWETGSHKCKRSSLSPFQTHEGKKKERRRERRAEGRGYILSSGG